MIAIASIQQEVAKSFRIPLHKMTEPLNRGLGKDGRNADCYSHPRQVAMYLATQLTNHSLKRIGYYFGRRDHSTVVFAVAAVERRISQDRALAEKVLWIAERLKSSESNRFSTGKLSCSMFVPASGTGKMAA